MGQALHTLKFSYHMLYPVSRENYQSVDQFSSVFAHVAPLKRVKTTPKR